MKQQKRKEKKEDPNDANQATISAILQSCKSDALKKLLRDKNVLYRSKLTTKKKMIDALSPILTTDDLNEITQDLGINYQITRQNPFGKESPKKMEDMNDFNYPKEGVRYNGAVMGVDVHKNTLVCAISNSTGIILEQTFENSRSGFKTIHQLVETFSCEAVAMESTGEYWLNFAWFLQDAKIPILVANPQQTKATQGIKTDQYDARRIAIAFRDGRLKPSVVCTRDQFALRKLGRDLLHYIEMETTHKNRINKILLNCDYGGLVYELITSDRGVKIIRGLCVCESIDDYFYCVEESYSKSRGKITTQSDLKDKTREYWSVREDLQKNQSFLRFVAEFESFCQAKEKASAFELEMVRMISERKSLRESVRLLLSIPSVGLRTALIMVAEIVDIRFFSSSKKFIKWCGLAPRVNQSGYHKRNNGRLCKSGNKFIRRAAYLAAQVDYNIGRKGPHPVGNFVRRIYEKYGIYKHSIVAGCHKLMSIVYAILIKRQKFNSDSYESLDIKCFEQRTQRKIADFNRYMVKSVTANPIAQFNEQITQHVNMMLENTNNLRILLKNIGIDEKRVAEV